MSFKAGDNVLVTFPAAPQGKHFNIGDRFVHIDDEQIPRKGKIIKFFNDDKDILAVHFDDWGDNKYLSLLGSGEVTLLED